MGQFQIQWIVPMLVCAAVMLWSWNKYRTGAHWGQPVAVLFGVLAVAFAALNLFSGGRGAEKIMKVQRKYHQIKAEKMGSYLAQKYPGSRALVLARPEPKERGRNARTKRLIDGLKKGFGQDISVVDVAGPEITDKLIEKVKEQYGPIPAEPPPEATGEEGETRPSSEGNVPPVPAERDPVDLVPMHMWFTPKSVDKLLNNYSDKIDLVVSVIGLPAGWTKMEFWRKEDQPAFALLESRGHRRHFVEALKQEKICAAVLNKPPKKYKVDKMPPSNLDKAFKKRYILMTPENASKVVTEYPKMFSTGTSSTSDSR